MSALHSQGALPLGPHAATADDAGVISPVQYGADPTGKQDSSTAFDAAIKAMLKLGSSTDFQGRIDLGGAIFDLMGGRYLVSEPVVIPAGYANFRVQRGTLIAAPQFPKAADRYILQIGGE